MSTISTEPEGNFAITPLRDGSCAGCCVGWHRWLWSVSVTHRDRAFWTRAAVTVARPLLVVRGNSRIRAAIQAAERLVLNFTPEAEKAAQQLRSRVDSICCGGLEGSAVSMASWTLRTALAKYTTPKEEHPPNRPLWGNWTPRDESDWVDCSFMALTYEAHAMAHIVRQEQHPYPPKWRYANDEDKLRVQAAVLQVMEQIA